ncbi:MAG: cob(I)yrinic acid a,c-diamide adenosyltransferase [Bdellovibrionaceae bacterium]|nr:cob(I)yrinic acid a,c-diamide adenosyltransferase [Pseudobdellovibrionaceae bacterium]MBX3033487.1 cob(I)yrinic acid a,c-diamide adenosyltransferase [Pseudobdellovibrionaceae bacterium]
MPSKLKVYTKTGDKGTTRLVDGTSVEKFNPRVEAYGTVDELNSQLGEVRLRLTADARLAGLESFFEDVQSELFNIGSLLACSKEETLKMLPAVQDSHIARLEGKIDELDQVLPELRNFILPAGHPATVALHVARTVCRRAERRAAEVSARDAHAAASLIYLNRLSDLLFVCARWTNHMTSTPDVIWKKT